MGMLELLAVGERAAVSFLGIEKVLVGERDLTELLGAVGRLLITPAPAVVVGVVLVVIGQGRVSPLCDFAALRETSGWKLSA